MNNVYYKYNKAQNWLRISSTYIPNLVQECVPTGKWNIGQLRKTWRLKSMKMEQAKKMAHNVLLLLVMKSYNVRTSAH